jgi:outer membrane receptor protein involved in Fe transport
MIRCVAAALIVSIVLSSGAFADAVDPGALSIEIPPTDLVTALEQLARQSRIEFIYSADQLKGIMTRGAKGTMTPREAVAKLLEGTHLTIAEHNDAMLISAAQTTALTSIPAPVTEGRAKQENAEQDAMSEHQASKNPALDEIVVTGTHIRGEIPVGSPLVIYTRTDIDRSGSATLDQFARTMPENSSSVDSIANQFSNIRFSPTAASNGTNAYQGAAFDLHGLGPTATLTLLNGERLAPGGLGASFTDISQIPLSAVDRVEVVPDGASAIYGADAVAGVVNIITRRDFNGTETGVRYGGSTEGGADEVTTSQLLGTSWESGNLLFDYEYDDQQGLEAAQRSYIPNLGGPYSLIPENHRNSIFIAGDSNMGPQTTLLGDILYSDRRFTAASTFSSPEESLTQTTVTTGLAQTLSATAGIDMALRADWHMQVTGHYSRNHQTSDLGTSVVQDASALDTQLIETTTPSIVDVDAITQGTLVTLPGGPLKGAAGMSYRVETYGSTVIQTSSGQATSTGEPSSKRQVFSAYAEFAGPVVLDPNAITGFHRIDLSLAGRYDYYSDFNSTLNPKLGLTWEIVPGLSVRGTFGTSFQAPLLSQAHSPLNIETQLLPNSSSPSGSTDTLIIQGGNLSLQPETSKSYTAAIDLKPPALPEWSLNMTFFYVNFTNRISTPLSSTGDIYSLNDALLAPYLARPPFTPGTVQGYFDSPAFSGDLARLGSAGVQAIFDDQLTNLGTTVESGIDVMSKYALIFDHGRLDLSVGAATLFEDSTRTVIFGPTASLVNAFAEPPKWKAHTRAVWTQGSLTAAASIDYVGAYRNSLFTPSQPISAWTTGDLYLGYDTGESMPAPFRRWVIALSINNVADARPPRVQIPASLTLPGENVIPFDPANASPVGRLISLSVKKHW